MENVPNTNLQNKNIYDDFRNFLNSRKYDPNIQNMTLREVIDLFYNESVSYV